jgi:hypothetical protein
MASATSPSSTNPLRNILIGVVTTVLGSGAVYYLGFQKKPSTDYSPLVMKEATTKGWDSYIEAENTFFNNWKILGSGYTNEGFDHYKEATLDELTRFKSHLKKILETKDIDPSFSSLLETRIQSKEQWEQKYKTHLDNYQNILQTASKEEITLRINTELTRFQNEVKDMDQRFANEIGNLCQTLNKNYGNNFSWSSLVMYQNQNNNSYTDTRSNTSYTNTNTGGTTSQGVVIDRRMLVGTWQVNNDYLYQYEDGRFTHYQNGNNYPGTWYVQNNLLYHNYGSGSRIYKLTQQSNESFTAEIIDSTHVSFKATRVNQ